MNADSEIIEVLKAIKRNSCRNSNSISGSSLSYTPVYNNGALSGYIAYSLDENGSQSAYYLDASGVPTLVAPTGSLTKTIDNKHAEILDTGTLVLSGIANYSYTVISGSAAITIDGVTISGVPVGFTGKQGETNPDELINDVTITGESLGTRIIVYYELA